MQQRNLGLNGSPTNYWLSKFEQVFKCYYAIPVSSSENGDNNADIYGWLQVLNKIMCLAQVRGIKCSEIASYC